MISPDSSKNNMDSISDKTDNPSEEWKELSKVIAEVLAETNAIEFELQNSDLKEEVLNDLKKRLEKQGKILKEISTSDHIKEIENEFVKYRKVRVTIWSWVAAIVSFLGLIYGLFQLGIIEKILGIFVKSASATTLTNDVPTVNMPVVFYAVLIFVSLLGLVSFLYMLFGKEEKARKFCSDYLKVVLGFYAGIISSVIDK